MGWGTFQDGRAVPRNHHRNRAVAVDREGRIVKPEDILPDGRNVVEANGIRVRKGSVGAFLANVRILADRDAASGARELARAQLVELVPALAAIGLFDVFAIRDAELAELVACELDRLRGLPR